MWCCSGEIGWTGTWVRGSVGERGRCELDGELEISGVAPARRNRRGEGRLCALFGVVGSELVHPEAARSRSE